MSKIKHLLRKFHIGSGADGLAEPTRPLSTGPASTSAALVSGPDSAAMRRITTVEPLGGDLTAEDGVDFNTMEEEFQVQLAMAISASNPDAREDADTAQIDAVKRISLGCSAPVTDADTHVDSISLRYWGHKVISYNEKVRDGFYDVYGVTSNSLSQGKMPRLVDLQAVSISHNDDYEVILVDRLVDHELLELEKRAYAVYLECLAFGHGQLPRLLVQNLADIVVAKMGGPVVNADEMMRSWTMRSYELRNLLKTIILPIGRLDFGLARHRALLFKVLADSINLPCMLVKGSYYTGTDDGAVNLIKLDDGSEYIIDLMGAPGALIPTEVPSSCLPISLPDARVYPDHLDTLRRLCLVLEQDVETAAISTIPNQVAVNFTSVFVGDSLVENQESENYRHVGERNQTERFEHDFGRLMQSQHKPGENLQAICGKSSTAQKIQVKNVSECVITAAKNPEFAQKLYAVLLDSGASPSSDTFPCTNLLNLGDRGIRRVHELPHVSSVQNQSLNDIICTEQTAVQVRERRRGSSTNIEACRAAPFNIAESRHQHLETNLLMEDKTQNEGSVVDNIWEVSNSEMKDSPGEHVACSDHDQRVNPLLDEVAEWEIPWEDLQIGQRIGIGSYGEVFHAEWNGTEVAVKKFLDQSLSCNVLGQFKSEVEIMLRLRHPNVVLFMGAVMRPPHFSILTEFLPRGSLYKLLHGSNSQLDEKKRLQMALDVAKGMNYLHTSHPTIVHRDLKSPNLLVDKNWVVKICDMGLSRIKHDTFLSSKSFAGTSEWMAPEVLRNEPANEKCDVYSFGVILWELATKSLPWKDLNPMQVVGAVGFQNRRLDIPEDVDKDVAQIIDDCWLREPHLRPSFAQLMNQLKHLEHLSIQRTNSTDLITM